MINDVEHFLCVLIGHFYIFLCEVSIQVFLSIIGLFIFLTIKLQVVFR